MICVNGEEIEAVCFIHGDIFLWALTEIQIWPVSLKDIKDKNGNAVPKDKIPVMEPTSVFSRIKEKEYDACSIHSVCQIMKAFYGYDPLIQRLIKKALTEIREY
jgi:hypothetical protein